MAENSTGLVEIRATNSCDPDSLKAPIAADSVHLSRTLKRRLVWFYKDTGAVSTVKVVKPVYFTLS